MVWMYQKDEQSQSLILTDKNIKNYSIKNKQEKKQIDAFNHEYLREYLDVIRYKYYYLVHSNLLIRGVQSDQNGLYFCKNEKNNKLSPIHRLTAQIPVKPKITEFKVDRIGLETKVLLICRYTGNPEPSVEFTKDGKDLKNVTLLTDPHETKIILERKNIRSEESFYICKISNRWGEDKKHLLLKINESNDTKKDELPEQGKLFYYLYIFVFKLK